MSGPGVHRIVLYPGEKLEVKFAEKLENGYRDPLGFIDIVWQERNAPVGEIATKGREVLVTISRDSRAGPLKLEHL